MHDLSIQKWKDTIGFQFKGELDRGLNAVQVTMERLDVFRMKNSADVIHISLPKGGWIREGSWGAHWGWCESYPTGPGGKCRFLQTAATADTTVTSPSTVHPPLQWHSCTENKRLNFWKINPTIWILFLTRLVCNQKRSLVLAQTVEYSTISGYSYSQHGWVVCRSCILWK